MVNQIGPQKLLDQLRDQAPQFAKLVPELPQLLIAYLRRGGNDTGAGAELRALLVEQQRTNRLLQSIIYGVLGFALGMVVMQIIVRVRLF